MAFFFLFSTLGVKMSKNTKLNPPNPNLRSEFRSNKRRCRYDVTSTAIDRFRKYPQKHSKLRNIAWFGLLGTVVESIHTS